MNNDAQKSWENLLDPKVLRPNLIMASIYIAAFEILKNSIIDRIKDFYMVGFDQTGPHFDPKYQFEVLARNSSPVYASLDWLKESHAIEDDDISTFEKVKTYRNNLANELPRILQRGIPSEMPEHFAEMVALLDKIERWWIVNVEIPTNPEFAGETIDEEKILAGSVMILQLMMDVALRNEEDSTKYINEFIKRTRHDETTA